jgi:LysM repeat protein
MPRQRLIVLIVIPAIVSLGVTLLVLSVWDANRQPQTIVLPTFSGVSWGTPSGLVPTSPAGGQTPDEEPQPTQTSETGQEPETETYTVQPGDTLGRIAARYEVSIEDIMIVNQLTDPHTLSVGQQLIIPIGGLPSPTPTREPTPTPTPEPSIPTPIPTPSPLPPGEVRVVVREVVGPGDITREAVCIENQGGSVPLRGWTLSDTDGNEYVIAEELTLYPNGGICIHTGVGEPTAIDLYWGLTRPVWGDKRDTVSLTDSEGEVQATYEIGQ